MSWFVPRGYAYPRLGIAGKCLIPVHCENCMKQLNTLCGQNTKRLNVKPDGSVHTAAGLLSNKRQSPFVGQVAVRISAKQPWRGLSEVTSPHDVVVMRTYAQNKSVVGRCRLNRKGSNFGWPRRLPSTFTAVIAKGHGQTVPRTYLAVTTFSCVSSVAQDKSRCSTSLPSTPSQFPTRWTPLNSTLQVLG